MKNKLKTILILVICLLFLSPVYGEERTGTIVSAPVTVGDSVVNTFPSAYQDEIHGGYKVVNTIDERNAITPGRRVIGMPCYVIENGITYRLVGEGEIEEDNWVEVSTVASNITEAQISDWNTAYAERLRWDGSNLGLIPATGRTSLGLGGLATLDAVSGGTGGTIADGSITNADISPDAAIAGSKISGWNATNWNTAYNQRYRWDGGSSGLIAATGRTALELHALATLDAVSGGLEGTITDNTITNVDIADGTIVNADVSNTAAIAGTKISPNFGSQNILTFGSVSAQNASFLTKTETALRAVSSAGKGCYMESGLLSGDRFEFRFTPLPGTVGTGHVFKIYGIGIVGTGRALWVDGHTYLNGHAHIAGTLTKSAGSFTIDHPLDPANKILNHSFVESPEMILIYKGRAKLENGSASISLPGYFDALNHPDGREISLTCINGWSPLYLNGKIEKNSFIVRTTPDGNQSQEFSWVIYAVRNDPYVQKHPMVVEVEKGTPGAGVEKGEYLNPDVYGIEQKETEEKGE